jgi:hypothetical protein
MFCFTTFVTRIYGKALIVMPKEVIENNSKDFISNAKDTFDVTLRTDKNTQLKANNIIYKSLSFQLKIKTSLITFNIAMETVVRKK